MNVDEIIMGEVLKLSEDYKLMVLSFARNLVNQQEIESLKQAQTADPKKD